MGRIIKRVLVLALALLLAIPVFPSVDVEASTTRTTFPKSVTLIYYGKKPTGKGALAYLWDGAKISKLKSSKPKNVAVKASVAKKYKGGYSSVLFLTAKKKGTSTISFEALIDGKTYKFKSKVIVSKYENPFKSLKIGSKNHASKFKKHIAPKWANSGKDKPKGKLNIVPQKGWKVSKIELASRQNGTLTFKKIKNKTNINMSKKAVEGLRVTMKKSKTGETYTATIWRR